MTLSRDPVEILQRLIRFNTTNPPGNEARCIKYIQSLFRDWNIESEIYAKEKSRPNLIARLPGRGEAPPLLFYGHIDVVAAASQEWLHDPFGGEIIDGYVWGRGALDMKGGVAMMLSSLLKLKEEGVIPPGDIVFLALSDEEVGGEYGAKFMVEEHADLFENIQFAIGEFGGFEFEFDGQRFYPIQVSEKQGCGLKIVVRGPAGHGSQVHQGGTLAKLGRLLTDLDKRLFPIQITPSAKFMIKAIAEHSSIYNKILLNSLLFLPGKELYLSLLGDSENLFSPLLRNTLNITLVNGGTAVNVLPSEVTLNADIRILPGSTPDDVIDEVHQIVGDDVEIEVVYYSQTSSVEPNMGLFPLLSEVMKKIDPGGIPIPFFMAVATDARFFDRLGIQTYGFTPMKGPLGYSFSEIVHAPNERILAESVLEGADALYKVMKANRPLK